MSTAFENYAFTWQPNNPVIPTLERLESVNRRWTKEIDNPVTKTKKWISSRMQNALRTLRWQ